MKTDTKIYLALSLRKLTFGNDANNILFQFQKAGSQFLFITIFWNFSSPIFWKLEKHYISKILKIETKKKNRD